MTVPAQFQVISHPSNLFAPAFRVKSIKKKKKKTQKPQTVFFSYVFLQFLNQTDCFPSCTNVQTVSSPLHLNPYGIKVKGFLSSDYSSNLLNNVLLPSFSAAAEIPPSSMIQPPNRTTVLPPPFSFSLSRIIFFWTRNRVLLYKKKRTEVTRHQ